MTWAHAALTSAAIMAVVSIFDSHLVSRRFSDIRPFLLLLGAIHMAYGLVLAALMPLPAGVDSTAPGWAVLSSVIRTGAIIIVLDGLRHQEVSAVIPVVYSYPMFVAIIAFLVLGETLGWHQWLAVAVVASGAVLISVNRGASRTRLGRRSALILISSPLFALADVTGKIALENVSFWNLFWIGAIVMSAVFLALSLRRSAVKGILASPDRNTAVGLVVLNEAIAPVGILISYWALQHGPVSLVSTLLSTRPLFVLLYASLLSLWAPNFLPWTGGRRLVVVRVLATLMIVAGIGVIEAF